MPLLVHADDPHYIAPLEMERRAHLSTQNPYFAHAEAAFWVAYRGATPVGRISAQIDRARFGLDGDATGHFGFLDAADAATVATLLETAEAWLAERGAARVQGPFSLSINDECGLLVSGFETAPMIMMPHGRAFYPQAVEAAGYRKAKDLLAYRLDVAPAPPATVARHLARAERDPAISLRPVRKATLKRDLEAIRLVFNDAWAENWGFVPMSEADIAYAAKGLRPIMRDGLAWIADVDGEPAAMIVGVPDANEALAGLGGRLFPTGVFHLFWRLKIRGPRGMRVLLMGVRRAQQRSLIGGTLVYVLVERLRREALRAGMERAELSWILEDNLPMRRMIETRGARVDKVYRIYRKDLA